jgi:hypothetical protein
MVVIKPGFGQKQAAVGQGIALPADVAQIDADLAVGHFAHRATILMGYPYRVSALLDHPRFIDQGDPVLFPSVSAIKV